MNLDVILYYLGMILVVLWMLTGKPDEAVLLGTIIYWGRGIKR